MSDCASASNAFTPSFELSHATISSSTARNTRIAFSRLRTLELCIDNLTPDFLDPILSTVLRDLMEALSNHLKPLPASLHPAHTAIRILGKLGGRNSRLLSKEPALNYQHHSDLARISISFKENIEFALREYLFTARPHSCIQLSGELSGYTFSQGIYLFCVS